MVMNFGRMELVAPQASIGNNVHGESDPRQMLGSQARLAPTRSNLVDAQLLGQYGGVGHGVAQDLTTAFATTAVNRRHDGWWCGGGVGRGGGGGKGGHTMRSHRAFGRRGTNQKLRNPDSSNDDECRKDCPLFLLQQQLLLWLELVGNTRSPSRIITHHMLVSVQKICYVAHLPGMPSFLSRASVARLVAGDANPF